MFGYTFYSLLFLVSCDGPKLEGGKGDAQSSFDGGVAEMGWVGVGGVARDFVVGQLGEGKTGESG